jgi:hypothetical protein
MKTQLVSNAAEALVDTLGSFDCDPAVRGIGILVAEQSELRRSMLESALKDLSVPVFGGVFPKLLFEGEMREEGAVVVGLDVEPQVTTVRELSDPDTDIRRRLPGYAVSHGRSSAFVFVDAFAARAEEFTRCLFDRYGVDVSVFGGGAGSLSMEQRPCIVTGDGLVADAGQFTVVETPASVGVKHGWTAIHGPLRVTDADGQRLKALNDEAALDVYSRIVERDTGERLTADAFFNTAKSYPFGISRLGGEMIVRDPYEVTDGDGLHCFGNVPKGEFVHVLRGDERSLVDAAAGAYEDAVRRDGPDVEGSVLCFDCISRVLYLGSAFDDEVDAIGGPDDPAVGALTIGEIANDGEGHLDYYNKTVVVAHVEGL